LIPPFKSNPIYFISALKTKSKSAILMGIALITVIATFLFVAPYPQWPEYHRFADDRTFFGIANAHNVISNIGFLIVGVWGTLFVLSRSGKAATRQMRASYLAYFIGVFLTALGSAYYHYQPDDRTLVWDRLPMTILFMGFFAAVIGELISSRTGNRLLAPLLIVGAVSVLYWARTESIGAGDLRLYGLVQFLPFIMIMLMLIMYTAPQHYASYIVGLAALLALAKLCELFDAEIYRTLGWVSGHALKHLFGAAATASVLLMLCHRRRLAKMGIRN